MIGFEAAGAQCRSLDTTIAPAPPFRRVGTGFNAAGKSTITSDSPVPPAARYTFWVAEVASNPHLLVCVSS